jgi:hypothetical protein
MDFRANSRFRVLRSELRCQRQPHLGVDFAIWECDHSRFGNLGFRYAAHKLTSSILRQRFFCASPQGQAVGPLQRAGRKR